MKTPVPGLENIQIIEAFIMIVSSFRVPMGRRNNYFRSVPALREHYFTQAELRGATNGYKELLRSYAVFPFQ